MKGHSRAPFYIRDSDMIIFGTDAAEHGEEMSCFRKSKNEWSLPGPAISAVRIYAFSIAAFWREADIDQRSISA